MAVLGTAIRSKVWRGLMRYWSINAEPTGFLKSDLYDPATNSGAIADADSWLDAHAGNTGDIVGYNGALQIGFRTSATAVQKALILATISAARVDPEAVRRLLSVGVD